MKMLFAILVLLCAIETTLAQVTQEWVARYNGPGNSNDVAHSIAVDGSGNVYVTGWSAVSGTNSDYATLKYNSSGAQQWVARYNGPGNSFDVAYSIALDDLGNVYVTGSSKGSGTDDDYATMMYNSTGVQQWVARYNGPGNSTDRAHSIAVDASGNVYVTGSSKGSGTDDDYATIKYNESGVQQWVVRYNGTGDSSDYAEALAVDDSGNVYVTGWSSGSGTDHDFTTIKYNSSGVQQWVERYNGHGNSGDVPSSLVVDGSGNVYVTGYSLGSGTDQDFATIKYNLSGVQQWVARYNGPGNSDDWPRSIAVDVSGNVFVTGSSFGSGTNSDYATLKYNSSGVQQWVARYNGPGNWSDESKSISLDGSGNVYVTGFSSVGVGINPDYASLKYNSSGVQQWVARYNYTDDAADAIALDGSGNVYVTGNSRGIGTYEDYATIKYSQSISIRQISSVVPERFSLLQNYPNPFNPSTGIEFSLAEKSFVKLKVFDIAGKEVAELVNDNLPAGKFLYEFSATGLSSGIYMYRLETEKFTESKKMIVLR